jgi:hypothetical protein
MDASVDHDAIYKLFRHNLRASGVADRIIEMRGNSRDILPRLASESFQIVFIDGSHIYDDVLCDIQQGKRLVCDGGVICGDDLEIHATDCDREFLTRASADGQDYCQDPRTGVFFHPGVTRAVHEAFGAVSVFDGLWMAQRKGAAWTPVQIDSPPCSIPDHLSFDQDEPRVEALHEVTAGDYNLHRVGDRILAVWQGLGEIDLLHEPVGVREWPPFVLIGHRVEDLAARVEALTASRSPRIELVGEVSGYNVLRANDKTYGLAQSLGPVALLGERLGEREMPPGLVIGDSVEEVVSRIRAISDVAAEARQAGARITQLQEEARNLSEAASRYQAALRDTEGRLEKTRSEAESAQRASNERAAQLEKRVEDVTGELRVSQKRLTAVVADLERAAIERRLLLEDLDRLRIEHQRIKDDNARLGQECALLTGTLASKADELNEVQRFIDDLMTELVEMKATWWYRWIVSRTTTTGKS